MSIDILLSTYNGELYLEAQIDSIIKQTNKLWILFIRDDGSTDNTREIISKYCKLYANKIVEIVDDNGNVGSTLSFSLLLEKSQSKYIMFCDQDDVWLEDKIENTFREIRILEKRFQHLPLMVFTDLCVVDDELNVLNESFMAEQKLFPDTLSNIHETIALNVVAGCTIMINNIAKKHILPFPKYLTHDHWIAMNIVYYGECKFLNEKTILYRQHGSNVYGALQINWKYFIKKLKLASQYISLLFLLKRRLLFNISIFKVIYYKIILSLKRL